MVRRIQNKLLLDGAVPEAIRNKVCEYLVLGYNHQMVSLMIQEQHEDFYIMPRHIMEFQHLNASMLRKWRKKVAGERAITRDSLVRKAHVVIQRRLDRAINDFQAFENINEKRADGYMDEEEYKRRKDTLYLPPSSELINLVNVIDRKLVAPSKRQDEQVDEDEPKPEIDPERQRAIEEATRNGDMIKLQELMFADTTAPLS